MYNVQYAAQRGAHTVHCHTILITMYNVQYAAQRGAHTVPCQTIYISTRNIQYASSMSCQWVRGKDITSQHSRLCNSLNHNNMNIQYITHIY